MKIKSTTLSLSTLVILLALVIVLPITAFPFFDNFLQSSKFLVALIASLVLAIFFLIGSFYKQGHKITVNGLSLSVLFFGIVALISSLTATQYPVQQFLGWGGMFLVFTTIALLGGALLPKNKAALFVESLGISGALVSVLTLLQATGFGPSWMLNSMAGLALPNNFTFNLIGSPFVAAQFIGLSLLMTVVAVVTSKKVTKSMFITVPLMVLGLGINTWISLPGKLATPIILPPTANWIIALSSIQTPLSALIGMGPDSFGVASTMFRPSWLNGTDSWGIRFTQGSNAPFTLLTTMGILGVAGWIALFWFCFSAAKKFRHNQQVFLPSVTALGVLLISLIFPLNFMMLMVLAIAIAFTIAGITPAVLTQAAVETHREQKMSSIIMLLVGIAALVILAYMVVRAYLASYYYFSALKAASQNDVVKSYELQSQAVATNPYIDTYRRQFALTNMQIAAALSNKAETTEDEKNQISQLIQQAIREARAATVISENDSQNWQVLAQIYQNLIGVAEDADQWTVSAYAQAIQTDPTNPVLRVTLGGIFYNAKQYSQAASLFQQAIDLKADYANAYYNMANTLVQLEDYLNAKAAYQQTLLLIEPDSEAYITASKELEQVEAKIKELGLDQQTATGSAQTTPESNSILDQNVNESQTDVVNPEQNTSLENLNQTPVEASPSPSEEATPSGVMEQ